MSLFFIVLCIILFVWSILEAFVFGEKYARWWFGQISKDYEEYDQKRFRLIRGTSVGIVFILSFLMGLTDFEHVWIYLLASAIVIALHYYLILHCCKKSITIPSEGKRTTYSNTRNPKLIKGIAIGCAAIGVALMVLYFVFRKSDFNFFIMGYWVCYFVFIYTEYKLRKVIVDDEQGLIYDNGNKKYPIQIPLISYVTYKETKKGRFRSLFIHDSGVKFMDIHTSKTNADAIVEQLLNANPSIEIRHANYL